VGVTITRKGDLYSSPGGYRCSRQGQISAVRATDAPDVHRYDRCMDLTTVFMPGAQSLVTAILTDTWAHARKTVVKLWVSRHADASEGRVVGELDVARGQALELAGEGPEAERAARMQLFWAGYLAGQAAACPELSAAFAELPALLDAGRFVSQSPTLYNTVSGTVQGGVVQTGEIHGDITFGR